MSHEWPTEPGSYWIQAGERELEVARVLLVGPEGNRTTAYAIGGGFAFRSEWPDVRWICRIPEPGSELSSIPSEELQRELAQRLGAAHCETLWEMLGNPAGKREVWVAALDDLAPVERAKAVAVVRADIACKDNERGLFSMLVEVQLIAAGDLA